MAAAKPAVRDVKGSYGLEELSDGKKGGEQVGNSKKLEQESSDEEGESSDEEEESSEQEEEARAPPSRVSPHRILSWSSGSPLHP